MGSMQRQTHVYGWEEEPADERPSEFLPTTGLSALSGYHFPAGLNARTARRRGSRFGLASVLTVFVLLLVLSGFVMYRLAG